MRVKLNHLYPAIGLTPLLATDRWWKAVGDAVEAIIGWRSHTEEGDSETTTFILVVVIEIIELLLSEMHPGIDLR